MTKQEFTTQLATALQSHGKAGAAAASQVADQIDLHAAKSAAGAPAIDWAHWAQVLESIIQVLAPLLQPVAAGAGAKKK